MPYIKKNTSFPVVNWYSKPLKAVSWPTIIMGMAVRLMHEGYIDIFAFMDVMWILYTYTYTNKRDPMAHA